KLEIFEAKYKGMKTLDVIREMNVLRQRKEAIEEDLAETNGEYDYIRLNLVPARFEQEGIENMRVEGIGMVSLTGDMYVAIRAANRQAAFEYFRDIGKGALITQTINSSTLKATVKAMIRSGEEIPEELITVTPFTRASITKR